MTELTYQAIRTSDRSFAANMVLLKGAKKAMLIDTPFTRADAHRVVAEILDSGLELETIYVTHNHPDHYYSAEVVRQAFPNAAFVAHPEVVAAIWHSLPFKQARWTDLGANGPRFPTAPAPLPPGTDTLWLEGNEIRILGPMQGDHPTNTALWVPSIRALFPSDLVHNQVVLWFVESTPEQIAEYACNIDMLLALDPLIVVPGHEKKGMPHDRSGLEFTRDYIAAWPEMVAQAKDSTDLIQLMKARFPDAGDPNKDFALITSAQVAMGEAPRWDE
ncbi:MBL fold metallo-hydrolase [Novosphingobium sp. FSY-8]|uniref:MBL fold metallo-hydrolase n=1 Tax=Novosphingobium ovatum TaxID=1908523 RepID=A0ABW9XA99_9SPHN|nr:MBL fold metallo-hydrolase [Novosphingobium ovatum]NBC35457.1 MBL fold metallo-hydrolase [Novosphingobium ovatum]